MSKMMFVNLPVTDPLASVAFYEALGGTLNPMFSDERSKCVMLSEHIGVMLLSHDRYRDFTSRPIGDAKANSFALLAISADNREAVDAAISAAAGAGGRADPNPAQDHGFMYNRTAEDPDGNVWEVMWMDPAAMGGAADQEGALA